MEGKIGRYHLQEDWRSNSGEPFSQEGLWDLKTLVVSVPELAGRPSFTGDPRSSPSRSSGFSKALDLLSGVNEHSM